MTKFFKKSCLALLLLVFGSVLLFDVGCYFLLPEDFSGRIFLGYRVGLLPDGTFGGGYPHHYYEAHPERGFDIGANKTPRPHYVFNYPANYSYPIWSNSLGCFDHEHKQMTEYIYLAGDSTTWGYAAFEKKFGSLLEDRVGMPILKCGVAHSGQLHQLSKMKEVVEKVGASPSLILVVWSPNDIVNDAFYPHSTTIDGWLVDTVHLTSEGRIGKDPEGEIVERVRQQERVLQSQFKAGRWFLVKYSATYNVLIRMFNHTAFGQWLAHGMYDNPKKNSFYALQGASNLLAVLPYRNDPLAIANQKALMRMREYADSVGAPLVVVLLALHENHNAEVRDFLAEKGFRFLDVRPSSFTFNNKNRTWRIDPHPNEEGNAAIAHAIEAYLLEQRLLKGSSPGS